MTKNSNKELIKACESGEIERIIELFNNSSSKPNINFQDKNGNTPLHLATKNNNCEIVKYLLKHDPNIKLKTKDGLTVLDIAQDNKNEEIQKMIIEYCNESLENYGELLNSLNENKEENVSGNESKESEILINEVKQNNIENVKKIIKSRKVNINNTDQNGWTALHWATYNENYMIVDILLKAKADYKIKTEQGIDNNDRLKRKTARELAYYRDNDEILRLLKKKKKNQKRKFNNFLLDTTYLFSLSFN